VQALEPEKKDIGHVFRQWHPDTTSKMFHSIARLCGADARLHDLRHSCATYLLKSGVPMEYVQKILGHASIKTTQIYAEVLQGVMQKEMEKLRFE
jgi:site-specific recombinase XerD